MEATALVLVPSILVIVLALTTRNVLMSLALGIVSASLIATNISPLATLMLSLKRIYEQTGIPDLLTLSGSYDKLYLFAFLTLIGILIEIMAHMGGIKAYTSLLLKRLKTQKQAQLNCLSLSFFFFIDDYLDALMVGSIMRPVTDHLRIARAKLAYLLNAVTSPLAVLIPASSWIGMILGQFMASGIHKSVSTNTLLNADPTLVYLALIPFLFYPLLSVFSAWYIVLRNISFGVMHKHEHMSLTTGNLFGGKEPIADSAPSSSDRSSVIDLVLPLSTFIVICLGLLLYSGNYWIFGGTQNLFNAFINANTLLSLFLASLCAVFVAAARFIYTGSGSIKTLASLGAIGFKLMCNSLGVLILAWAFSKILQDDLHTGQYIAGMFLQSLNLVFVPLILFLIAAGTTASIGSSWGTISLLMPLALPLLAGLVGTPPLSASYIMLIAPSIGALLSGAVAGAHFSPVTDSMIMASTSARSHHIDHTNTMASYSFSPFLGSVVAFILLGLFYHQSIVITSGLSLIIGLLVTAGTLEIRNTRKKIGT